MFTKFKLYVEVNLQSPGIPVVHFGSTRDTEVLRQVIRLEVQSPVPEISDRLWSTASIRFAVATAMLKFVHCIVTHSIFISLAFFSVDASVVFGTVNGYDVGGTDSLCFVSNGNINSNTTRAVNQSGYVSIETLNSDLYNGNNKVRLLPQCFGGTQLDLFPLDLGNDRVLYIGRPYTFRLELEINVTTIHRDILVQALKGKATIHARLQLCNVVQQGFCNPLVDARETYSRVRPIDTDLGTNVGDEYAFGESKWNYVEGKTLLGIPQGPLVFSRWVKWTLKEITAESPVYRTSINITFQLPNGIPAGAYFFVGHAIMTFDLNSTTRQRIDVANALPNNVVEVREHPLIRTVSRKMTIVLGAMVGITGSMALCMFVFVLLHRQHPVMLLAQASFLAAMTGACLWEIVATLLFLPLRDIHCSLTGPMVIIPMTLVAACLVGRICRVHRTLAVVQRFGRRNPDDTTNTSEWEEQFISALFALANLPFHFARRTQKSALQRRKGLRQTATANETISLIAFLTLPQLFVQVLVAFLVDRRLEEVLDPFGKVGQVVCSSSGRWASTFGITYTAFVFMIAVMAAWVSRALPSVFNEKEQVFHVASISTVLTLVCLSLLETAHNPATHPDVLVLLRSITSIGISCCVLLLIVLPKIRRVLSGEKVVMSAILGTKAAWSCSSEMTPPYQRKSDTGDSVPERVIALAATREANSFQFKTDQPLPSSVEHKILGAQNTLRKATERFIGGRQLSSAEFTKLQKEIAILNDELDLVEIGDGE